MLLFKDLKSIILLLEKNKITYYVFGGIALEGLRETMSREHGDLDLYIKDKDLEKFCKIMSAKKYSCKKRERMYFFEKNMIKIGVVILTKEKRAYISNGNKTRAIYPEKIFATKNYGKINKIIFCIAPNEVLAFESKYSRYPEDKKYGTKLPKNKILFKKIKYEILRK